MSDYDTKDDLFLGEGVTALCVAFVPGRAVINGKFHSAIDAKELEVQTYGVVPGNTQAAAISVAGQLNDSVHATKTLVIGSTGQVSGDISYGTLEISKGGEILGKMKQL